MTKSGLVMYLAAVCMIVHLNDCLAVEPSGGLAAGQMLPKLESVVCVGDKAGERVELTAARGNKPTIYIFIQAEHWDRPVARLVRGLDMKITEKVTDGGLVVVWLSNNEVDRFREHLPRVQQSLQLALTTYCVWPGDAFGPTAWGLNRDDHVTVVTARDGRVLGSHRFRSTNEADAAKILADLGVKE